MFSRILAAVVLMASVALTMEVAVAETSLPSQESFYAAREAFYKGNFEPIRAYWVQKLAWYEEAMQDEFDSEKFAAGMKAGGHSVTSEDIRRAHELSRSMSEVLFQPPAAEAARWLGDLSCLHLKYGEAVKYYRRAVELQPQNPKYAAELKKAIASAADMHQPID